MACSPRSRAAGCGAGCYLSAAFVLERALYDYRDQLYVMVKLAEADVAAATAGVTSAIAGGADAAQAMLSATADTTMSVGARSFQIGLAAVGIAAAVAGARRGARTVLVERYGFLGGMGTNA